MSISNYAVLIFLLEIITETYGTSSCNNDNNWQVATFCETTQATGNSVVLDGYGVYQDSSSEKRCHCIAVVSIPNNGSSSLVFGKLYSLQPNYIGCGSYISVSDSDDTVIHHCVVAGTMTVENQEKVDIELVKESAPEDTRYCMTIRVADTAASLTVTCNPDANTTTTIAQSSVTSSTTSQFTTSSLREDTTSMSTTKGTATEITSRQSTRPSSTSTSSTSINSTGLTDIFDDVIDTTSTTAESSFSTPFITDTTTSQKPSTSDITISTRKSSSVGMKSESTLLATDTPTTMTSTSVDALSTSTKQTKTTQQETDSPSTKMTSTSLQETSPKSSTEAPSTLTDTSSRTQTKTLTTTTTSPPSSSSPTTKQTSVATPNISSSIITTTVRTSVESTSTHSTTTVQHSSDKSSQMPIDSSSKQSSTASLQKEEDDLPIEIIIPVAIVGGLLIIILIICVAIGIRRKGCRCNDEHTASSNNLVDKVSVDIKNREKDTYVNPLYDDISLTGKSDRSDRDSMMQEHPSDDGEDIFDSYHLPASTEIDGELWTHL